MELTSEQKQILEGGQGPYLATSMRWIAEWGRVMGARRLDFALCDRSSGGRMRLLSDPDPEEVP